MGLEYENAFLSLIAISCPMLTNGRPGFKVEVTILELQCGMAA